MKTAGKLWVPLDNYPSVSFFFPPFFFLFITPPSSLAPLPVSLFQKSDQDQSVEKMGGAKDRGVAVKKKKKVEGGKMEGWKKGGGGSFASVGVSRIN